ncbi:hypothetical protein DL765_007355 [Monosporascus sp. GIB2]|nr:hypothetical protein DL765_007355 [Monosporascus sp. GIB2]
MSISLNKQSGPGGLSSLQKPTRRLACRRCNRQKLQCRWEEEGDKACIRCRRANAVCISSVPRRLGTPAQCLSPQGNRSDHRQEQRQQQPEQQQEPIDVPGSPRADSGAHIISSANEWAGFQRWVTMLTAANNNIVPGLSADGQSALHSMSHQLGDDDLWPFTIGEISSSMPTNMPATPSSLATAVDVGMEQIELLGKASPIQPDIVDQQPTSPNCHETGPQQPLDEQKMCVNKFWNLLQLLYQRSKQVKSVTEAGTDRATTGAGSVPRVSVTNAPYPLDRIFSIS